MYHNSHSLPARRRPLNKWKYKWSKPNRLYRENDLSRFLRHQCNFLLGERITLLHPSCHPHRCLWEGSIYLINLAFSPECLGCSLNPSHPSHIRCRWYWDYLHRCNCQYLHDYARSLRRLHLSCGTRRDLNRHEDQACSPNSTSEDQTLLHDDDDD